MIYTIGNRESYLSAIAAEGTIFKLGKREPGDEWYPAGYEGTYPGGTVFQTLEDVEAYFGTIGELDKFAVFGVAADWEKDTEPSPEGPWHNLLVDAKIILLE